MRKRSLFIQPLRTVLNFRRRTGNLQHCRGAVVVDATVAVLGKTVPKGPNTTHDTRPSGEISLLFYDHEFRR